MPDKYQKVIIGKMSRFGDLIRGKAPEPAAAPAPAPAPAPEPVVEKVEEVAPPVQQRVHKKTLRRSSAN